MLKEIKKKTYYISSFQSSRKRNKKSTEIKLGCPPK